MRVIVLHEGYGCDTGCCGHTVVLEDGTDEQRRFDFAHPYLSPSDPNYAEKVKDFARELVTDTFGAEHVADIAWDDCHIVDC